VVVVVEKGTRAVAKYALTSALEIGGLKAHYDRRLTKKVRRSKCKLRTCSDRNCDAGVGLGERMVEEARLGNSSGLLYSITKTTHVKNLQPRFSKTYLLIYKFAFFDLLGLEES
jgi:hypothetical protein